MRYSRKRAMAQVSATSLKSAKLPVNTILTVEEIRKSELLPKAGQEVGDPNDVMLCNTSDGRVTIPMREYTKMKTAEGVKLWSGEAEASDIELPERFKIVKMEDRLDRNKNVVYPIFAYNGVEAQLQTNNVNWNELVASGLKENHGYDAVQNYTIEIL